MPDGISGSFSSPKVDFIVDMGNPLLNLAVDGFLKIGAVATAKVAAEETYDILIRQGRPSSVSTLNESTNVEHQPKGSITSQKLEYSLRRMCREGACWGAVAGVYVGMEYGVERIRGTKDWKNALISGALTGAIVSAASNRNRDKIVMDAIAGGALATASEFLNYLT